MRPGLGPRVGSHHPSERCRVEKSLLWENTGFLAALSFGLRHGRLE